MKAKTDSKTVEQPTVEKRTKKSIVVKMISTKTGSTVDNIAQAIVDEGIDVDLEKNKRTVKLWMSKIGFAVEKLEGGLYRKA